MIYLIIRRSISNFLKKKFTGIISIIIIRYLIRETLKTQISILFILILIFFSQKTINILTSAVHGNIPSDLIFSLLWLGIPEMAKFIFPLSLLIGLLMSYRKFHIDSEIIVMYACGLGKKLLVIAALILALFTALFATVNVIWMLPWSEKYQEKILKDAKTNPSLAGIVKGQFKITKDKNIVFYVSDIKGKNFTNIFMAQLLPSNNQLPSLVIAENGLIREDEKGNKIVVLDKGTRYEGTVLLPDFRITNFKDYQAVIDYKETIVKGDKIKQKDMLKLWCSRDLQSKVEFHWRLTLVISVFIMALIVVPLSQVNYRQGRVLNIFPSMFIYMIFFLSQSTVYSNSEKSEIDSRIMMWLLNGIFLLLSIILNIWDTVLIRRLRNKFYKGIA